jgi:hypothetical protein
MERFGTPVRKPGRGELVRRLLVLAKLHEGLDELDPNAEDLIQLNVVEGLEEELGDRSPLLSNRFLAPDQGVFHRRQDKGGWLQGDGWTQLDRAIWLRKIV